MLADGRGPVSHRRLDFSPYKKLYFRLKNTIFIVGSDSIFIAVSQECSFLPHLLQTRFLMEHGEILNSLKSALSLRYNDKIIYQRKVAEALNTNIPSVRRRFSGKNSFTLKEISLISERLDIPIDEIFDNCSSRNSYPLEFLEYSLTHSGRNHNEVFYNTNEMFRYAGQSVNSQLCISCNKLPDVLKANYMGFARFTALQWLYLKFGPDSLVPLSDIPLLPDTEKLLEEYLSHIYSFKNIVCLLNNNIIGDYLSDIRQFYILEYLGREEAEILAAEVEKLLGGGLKRCVPPAACETARKWRFIVRIHISLATFI